MSLVMFGGLGDKQGSRDTLGAALCAQGISMGYLPGDFPRGSLVGYAAPRAALPLLCITLRAYIARC